MDGFLRWYWLAGFPILLDWPLGIVDWPSTVSLVLGAVVWTGLFVEVSRWWRRRNRVRLDVSGPTWPVEVDIAPGHDRYPRVDLVGWSLVDEGPFARAEVIEGIPAIVPIAPAYPPRFLPLALVWVPAGSSLISRVDPLVYPPRVWRVHEQRQVVVVESPSTRP
jgi:hypothetical protein